MPKSLPITVDGTTYLISEMTAGALRQTQDRACQVLHPVHVLRQQIDDSIPEDVVKDMYRRAHEHSLLNPIKAEQVSDWMGTPEGMSYLFFQLLKINHPTMTQDQSDDILAKVGREKIEEVLGELSKEEPTENPTTRPRKGRRR